MAATEARLDTIDVVLRQLAATRPLELAAVLLGFAYIALAIRQRRLCWLAGGLSTALYILVFLDARLYLQSVLQVLYVVLAAYGWWEWGRDATAGSGIAIRRWSLLRHAAVIGLVASATALTAPMLYAWTDAAAPWADAAGTWASVAATWMMVRKVAANWIWWIGVDAGLAWLYASQGLAFTAVLYLAFALLAVAGWWAWRSGSRLA